MVNYTNDAPRRSSPCTTNASSKSKRYLSSKKIPKNDHSKHEYFDPSHKCSLPSEKVNSYPIQCGLLRKWLLNLTSVDMRDARATSIYRSYSALCVEKYRQYKFYPFSIHPFCKLRVSLEATIVFSIVVTAAVLAFDVSREEPNEVHLSVSIIFIISECFYILNILMNFFTGYVTGDTHKYVILNLKNIVCHYIRTWLLVDVLSTIGIVAVYMAISDSTRLYWYLFLETLKLLRTPILLKYLHNVLTAWRIGVFGRTLIEIFILSSMYVIWNIYFQFAVEYVEEGSVAPENPYNCSWITVAKLWNAKSSIRFTYTLDRAISMLRRNANINLVEKPGCFEKYFIVAWIIAKLLVYHCVFKYMVSIFGMESAKAKYFIMIQQVATFIKQKKYPPRIREKILKFYAIRYQSHYFAEAQMFSCITGQLHQDIIMHTGRQLVQELEFLKHLPKSLLLQIGLKLKLVIFIAGDIIFKINTVGDCLYFIDKGTVAIYSESGNEICHLEDGDYFGEIALVMKQPTRTASAVAVTNCELFRLDKADFDSSIACYPTVYENIKKVATNRYERTCVLDEHHKAELKMEEDHVLKKYMSATSLQRGLSSEDRQ